MLLDLPDRLLQHAVVLTAERLGIVFALAAVLSVGVGGKLALRWDIARRNEIDVV